MQNAKPEMFTAPTPIQNPAKKGRLEPRLLNPSLPMCAMYFPLSFRCRRVLLLLVVVPLSSFPNCLTKCRGLVVNRESLFTSQQPENIRESRDQIYLRILLPNEASNQEKRIFFPTSILPAVIDQQHAG